MAQESSLKLRRSSLGKARRNSMFSGSGLRRCTGCHTAPARNTPISAVPMPVIGFDNPLPPNVPDHVAAIAVFGNPSAKLGLPLTVSPIWGGRSIDLCNGGDPICQTDGENIAAHKAYAGGQTNQAANFAAGLL